MVGDAVNLDMTNASASFANKNAGVGKTVTFAGFTIFGGDVDNYTVTQPANSTATALTNSGTVSMPTSTSNQDPCQGAILTLNLSSN